MVSADHFDSYAVVEGESRCLSHRDRGVWDNLQGLGLLAFAAAGLDNGNNSKGQAPWTRAHCI